MMNAELAIIRQNGCKNHWGQVSTYRLFFGGGGGGGGDRDLEDVDCFPIKFTCALIRL